MNDARNAGGKSDLQEWGTQVFYASTVPQLLLRFDTGEILCANEAATHFFERPVEELHGRPISDFSFVGNCWTPELRQHLLETRFGIEYAQYLCPSGQVRSAEMHYSLMSHEDEKVIHVYIVDISHKEALQHSLQQLQLQYRAFLELSQEGIWFDRFTEPIPIDLPIDEQIRLQMERSRLVVCNYAFCRTWGYERPEQMLGRPTTDWFRPEVESHYELMRTFIEAGYSLRNHLVSVRLPDGTTIYHLCNIKGWIEYGKLLGIWGSFTDVTELMRIQTRLSEREAIYREFVEMSHQGIARFEAPEPIPIDLPIEEQIQRIEQNAILAECSPPYAQMLGYQSPQEIVGKRYGEVVWIDNPLNRDVLKAFVEGGYRIQAREMMGKTPEGEIRYRLISVSGVVRDGYLIRGWVIAQDITELRRLQEQLAQAYRLESIGRLAGGIAHDFNNILTAVMGYAELLSSQIDEPALKRYAEGILKAGQRGSELTHQLLAYARRQVIQKSPTNFREVLSDIDAILNRLFGSSVILEIDIAPDLWLTLADRGQLAQVVLNLATNARDAMPEGGKLTIRLTNHTQTEPSPRGLQSGDYVKLEVSDTGMGIPDTILLHIFEPFYTTKPQGKGTGMGLAAVDGIVRQLGGAIEVETELGRGTTFRVYFPRYVPEEALSETTAS